MGFQAPHLGSINFHCKAHSPSGELKLSKQIVLWTMGHLWPCCSSTEETFSHVLSCPDATVTANRIIAFDHLIPQLKAAGTPEKILAVLSYRTEQLEKSSDPSHGHAFTARSLYAGDTILRMVLLEQDHSIGWYQPFSAEFVSCEKRLMQCKKGLP